MHASILVVLSHTAHGPVHRTTPLVLSGGTELRPNLCWRQVAGRVSVLGPFDVGSLDAVNVAATQYFNLVGPTSVAP